MSSRFDRVEDWKAYAAQCHYSITLMAQACKISRQQLRRRCLQSLGNTPKKLIEEERLEAAMRFLRAGKLVKEVAALLGFSQTSHFTRFFERKTSLSPSQFQRMFPRGNKYSANVP
jgi:AraC-like DNA-binding protein